ncbi:hypothetical protein [Thalassococcus sp. S3]|nr:hypothetical protein [Thalassococcus sp. S3]
MQGHDLMASLNRDHRDMLLSNGFEGRFQDFDTIYKHLTRIPHCI